MGAIADPNPVVFIEHRWLHNKEGEVPEEAYALPLGKAVVAAKGKDLTCVALSYQVLEALAARDELLKEGIEMEVIDLRTIRPLDKATVLESVRKTGRLLVTDIGHAQFGACAEVSAVVAEEGFGFLKAPIKRVALPDCPTPCSSVLEQAYYPNVGDLVNAARGLVKAKRTALDSSSNLKNDVSFTGPF
ncbi:MAG: transketolase C-terminal domain-containing protein [Bdellovibrionota bacterium]